ncbi:Gfo/Idh/MocA family oxidoreductase [Nocardioides anomalus]|uniref:Gfo/Idh/MocA family oxidoreductase n=1 Tax=Nocardioides anomalus TaxID=2712223 RepID=A0A6G6WDF9_9ACTN|nr:Gfo/Idh/MocA family oxidoreductase [Nocardioides anomalus]QIG43381.1 Gfo/Idh/MocA family oxidoreductase [Nocardioides anomalus]
MSDVLEVGLVGAGYIAHSHARAYAADRRAHLAYVVEPVAEKADALARTSGAQVLGSLDELLASDVEVISVCTPSPTHADLVVAALGAGKHVLCEKPVARTLADADRIVAAGRTGPGLLMIGHVSRFEPDHRAAYDAVRDGRIGEVRMMAQSLVGERPTWSEDDWLRDPDRSGGPLVDLAIHSFDYLTWVSGARPVRVHAVGSAGADGVVDYAVATVRYDTGALAVVETSWAHPAGHGLELTTELTGSDGRITWDYDSTAVGSVKLAGAAPRTISQLGNRGFVAEVAAFLDAVEDGGPSPVQAEDGRLALEVALAAVESLRTRRVVHLSDRSEETA